MSNNVETKVIVVTGASSGLGEATARHLAAKGAKVVLGARRTERIGALADECGGEGNALALTTDVTDRNQVSRLVDTAVDNFGRVDVMINNAGLMQQSPLELLKVDEWDRMIDVNIKGVLYGIAAALPHMKRQKSGHVINVSSVAGPKVTPAGSVYCATKHGVRAEVADRLRCFDLSTGKELWEFSYDAPGAVMFPGSRSVPTVDGDRVYSCGHNGDFYCIDTETHKPLWHKNIWTDFGGTAADGSTGGQPRQPRTRDENIAVFPVWAMSRV